MTELKVVAITGSNGKTTTKEMVAAILASAAGADAVLKTEGNLNNHLGVPLTLLRLHAGHRYAVVEMGMSGLGEIAYLTKLARPDVAAVVSIAAGAPRAARDRSRTSRAPRPRSSAGLGAGGVAVYPADEPLLRRARAPRCARRMTFGPQARRARRWRTTTSTPGPTGLTLRAAPVAASPRRSASPRTCRSSGGTTRPTRRRRPAVALALDVGEGSILDGLANVAAGQASRRSCAGRRPHHPRRLLQRRRRPRCAPRSTRSSDIAPPRRAEDRGARRHARARPRLGEAARRGRRLRGGTPSIA